MAISATSAGVIDVVLDYSVVVTAQIQGGKLRPLAVTGNTRLKHLPDVKTIEEQGYPGVWLTAWSSVLVASGTPQPVVDKLADAFADMLQDPRIQKYADDNGAKLMVGIKKEKFRDFIVQDQAKLKAVIDKANIKLEGVEKASITDSKKVVEICTQYAQRGMFNIFLAVFFITLAFACVGEYFFIGYLISIAIFGLYQAIFMANAGGAWDNAKKIVEVNLRQKGTPLHAAVVVGDTVGDPFKDTSSVALNPIIKFTTLFGLLAVELAIKIEDNNTRMMWAALLFAVAVVFVWRSFYAMRISAEKA